jgi:polyphosphate kinase 2 (PPK2 family)
MAKGKGGKAESGPPDLVETTAVPQAEETETVVQTPAGMSNKDYRRELAGLQVQLIKFQHWIAGSKRPAVVVLEGLGPAGKHTTALSILDGLHKRVGEVVTLEPPRKRERGQWHFQRYVERFPGAGRVIVFDGSWYHYPALECALGACNQADFAAFLEQCANFEQSLTAGGLILIKYWFSASDEMQEQRFREHVAELSRHKQFYIPQSELTNAPMNVGQVRDEILAATSRYSAPWYVIPAEDKREARLAVLRHLISLVPVVNTEVEPGP